MTYPDRFDIPYGDIDWAEAMTLEFEPPDREAFPCLDLAYEAGRSGGTAPAWLSACNEVAVEAFLKGLMPWTGIADVNSRLLEQHDGAPAEGIEAILEADERAREAAWTHIRGSM